MITYQRFKEELTENSLSGGLIEDGTAMDHNSDFTYFFMNGRSTYVWYVDDTFIFTNKGIYGEGETLENAIKDQKSKQDYYLKQRELNKTLYE